MKNETAGLVREVRELLGDNQAAFARRMGVNQTMISHYETGVRDLERSDNALHLFLNLARQTPGEQRSESLQEWIEATIRHYEEHPVGGRILMDNPDTMQIQIKGFQKNVPDLHLAATVEMIECYIVESDELAGEDEKRLDFQEAILTALCRQNSWGFEEESMTAEQMMPHILDALRLGNRLQVIVTDHDPIEDEDFDEIFSDLERG